MEIWHKDFGSHRNIFVHTNSLSIFICINVYNDLIGLANYVCHNLLKHCYGIHSTFGHWPLRSTILCTFCIKLGSQVVYIWSIVFIVILSQYWSMRSMQFLASKIKVYISLQGDMTHSILWSGQSVTIGLYNNPYVTYVTIYNNLFS